MMAVRTPTDAELLDAWERAAAEPPPARALRLLAACTQASDDELRALPVGRRDALLLELRVRLFGPQIESLAECPACHEQLELAFPAHAIRAEAEPPDDPLQVSFGAYTVTARLPTAGDLLALHAANGAARELLLERCVLAVEGGPAEPLPDEVVGALAQHMAAADPQADVQIALSCPACGAAWSAPFDIVSFLWRELDAWARRTLREVHTLARAYGWREPDVLALSPRRRRAYIELALG